MDTSGGGKYGERAGIIVQARMGSSRLPGKVALPFLGSRSMLEVILERLVPAGLPRLVATSVLPQDDAIATLARKAGVPVFRGHAEDVLRRFIDAGNFLKVGHVLRVCADSPFLSPRLLGLLIEAGERLPEADYLSFTWEGQPTILSHLGVFAEWVSLQALERAAQATNEPVHREHVTNYLYRHPEGFRLEWLQTPEDFNPPDHCRLTVDTLADLSVCQRIYRDLREAGFPMPDYLEVFDYLFRHPEWRREMEEQIKLNRK